MDATSPPLAAAPLTHGEIRSIIVGIILAMLLAALDQTIVATALPTIGRDLGDPQHMPWIVTSYLLAATAVTPLYGKLSDIHGRRVVLLSGIAIFVVGSIACALAPTMLTLILARTLQGLGGGGLISLAQTIIADVVAPRERARYQVYIAGVFVSSSLLGPVLGGLFADHLHWSVIFWINLPLGLLAYWMTSRALKHLPRHERPHRLDLLGAALLVGATVTILLALSWGGLSYPWLSAPILGLFAGSAVLWFALAARLRSASEPFISAAILANPVVRAGTLAAGFGMGTYIGLTIYMPVYFEAMLGFSASGSGLALIPLMIGTVLGATASGRAMARVRHYRRIPVVGLSVAIAGTAILVAMPQGLPFVGLEVLLAAISLGLGTLLPVSTVSIQNAVEPHELGTATGVANFFRQIGGAFIVAVLGAIVLSGVPVSAGASHETLAGTMRGGGDLTGVFRLMFAAALTGFALALVFLLRMEERPLRSGAEPAPVTE
ncbi:MDR family MFS transporter [Salinarimonas soli]|uniref:MFS transporter n=1 Tax=Salinarimonas soli TaxID=1638099 RepID=A0A5B2V9J0_9HYPH|nr:MDR family MFS transporter [Salinarimonas soli]KAA2235110.1 MFS transporter [Salinarimonas soli]